MSGKIINWYHVHEIVKGYTLSGSFTSSNLTEEVIAYLVENYDNSERYYTNIVNLFDFNYGIFNEYINYLKNKGIKIDTMIKELNKLSFDEDLKIDLISTLNNFE